MAQSSLFWDTSGGVGDGAAEYTQAQWIDFWRNIFVNDPTTQGILKGALSDLEPTVDGANLSVAPGMAFLYGFPYFSTADEAVAVPVSAIGTTGHRLVLRADWVAQTVRLALLSSADGVAAIPALTQTPGATYEISLATLTKTIGGVITLTDTRGYVHPNTMVSTDMIDDLAVTSAKLAVAVVAMLVTNGNSHDHNGGDGAPIPAGGLADGAVNATAKLANNIVDSTKIGNLVLGMLGRQGGSATNWATYGTTDYTPGAVRIQTGVYTITSLGAGSGSNYTITYPVAFSNPPVFLYNIDLPSGGTCVVTRTSELADGEVLYVFNAGGSAIPRINIYWQAIGPE